MKNLILCLSLIITALVSSQNEFIILENGLTPTKRTIKSNSFDKSELFNKTLAWIEKNKKKYDLSLNHMVENDLLKFSSIKGNAVVLDKQYYNIKYTIQISLTEETYTFEPIEIQLKLNSKYDMGWKNFDFTNGAIYFKKGKVIRKYRSYITSISAPLNELYRNLSYYLNRN